MNVRRVGGQTVGYGSVLLVSFVLAVVAGWLGAPIDNYAYDWMFRRHQPPPREPEAILLAVDEATLSAMGGMRGLRRSLADGLERIAAAGPKTVAIDLILADAGDPFDDDALEAAFAKLPGLVLACDVVEESGRWTWEHPLERFRRHAAALGHVHGDPGPLDGVSRFVPLEQVAARERHWALALEAFRLSRGAGHILESPEDLTVAGHRIPAARRDSRSIRIRYLPPPPQGGSTLPRVSIKQLRDHPALAARFAGKVVFVGVTAQSAMRDRMLTPYSYGAYMPGIEIHASIYETLARGEFLVSAPEWATVLLCLGLAAAGVLIFALWNGWLAYVPAAILIAAAHALAYVLFTRNIVLPYLAPVTAAWLSVVGAGAFQFLTVRRQLRRSETEKTRYQQAMHFVTHEMRTPLTAIQGSSELMQRYKLSDEKRRQIADLINSESRRLAKMIETFLSVERLSAGEIELKRETFPVPEFVAACLERTRPLADRKQIRLRVEALEESALTGDRELMEYALYNLLTNAVKYSPAGSEVGVMARLDGEHLRLSVTDQGIGMDKRELKKIFQRFYRTAGAEASGEKGTGIGLSIVEQILARHEGRIEVASAPGRGSCFTLVLPARKSERAAEAKTVS